MNTANVGNIKFSLFINGAVANNDQGNATTAGGNKLLIGLTAVERITTKGSTVTIVNQSAGGANIVINNSVPDGAGVKAFLTIVKLQ